MSRMKTTKSIDDKIREYEEKLIKLKEKCDSITDKLDALYVEKKEMESKEIMEAISKSSRTRAEILAFLESA